MFSLASTSKLNLFDTWPFGQLWGQIKGWRNRTICLKFFLHVLWTPESLYTDFEENPTVGGFSLQIVRYPVSCIIYIIIFCTHKKVVFYKCIFYINQFYISRMYEELTWYYVNVLCTWNLTPDRTIYKNKYRTNKYKKEPSKSFYLESWVLERPQITNIENWNGMLNAKCQKYVVCCRQFKILLHSQIRVS